MTALGRSAGDAGQIGDSNDVALRRSIAVGDDVTIGIGDPAPRPSGDAAIPTTGLFGGWEPAEPRKPASAKENTPPSEPTSQ